MKKYKAFTFVELIVVVTIIAVLFSIGAVSFSTVSKKSRDARRKGDIESIRSALELCRSYTGVYPNSVYPSIVCSDGSVTLTATPTDPKSAANYSYNYQTSTSYTISTSSMEALTNPYTLTSP